MKRTYIFIVILFLALCLNAQPWEMDNSVFNPSGVPSFSFSQPRFMDLDSDGDFDFWLGNTNRPPLYLQNNERRGHRSSGKLTSLSTLKRRGHRSSGRLTSLSTIKRRGHRSSGMLTSLSTK